MTNLCEMFLCVIAGNLITCYVNICVFKCINMNGCELYMFT